MGLYSRYVFPVIMDALLGQKDIGKLRRQVLSGVRGKVLEIGAGTGLNFAHYPRSVLSVTAIDANPGMRSKAEKRMKASRIGVDYHQLRGEKLPFPDESFDSVVSTFTLCSIAEAPRALKEIRRVLKKGGRFFFLEHGRSDDPSVARWQNWLNPINKRIADGCQLNRDIKELIKRAGLHLESFKNYYFPKVPKPVGYYYQGTAYKKRSS